MSVQDRREREREQRRASILEAAEHLFFSRGPQATVDEIAAEAEVAKGTVYLYFSSKEDLYMTIVERALTLLLEKFRKAVDSSLPPPEKLKSIGEAYREFFGNHPNYFKLLTESSFPIVDSSVSPEILDAVYGRSYEVWEVISDVFQKGIDSGVFKSELSAFEMSILLWNNSTGLLRLQLTLSQPNVWRGKTDRYSMYNLDVPALMATSNRMMIEAFLARPVRAGTGGGEDR